MTGKTDLIEGLLKDAFDVLHHDCDSKSEAGKWEMTTLRSKFAERLGVPVAPTEETQGEARSAG